MHQGFHKIGGEVMSTFNPQQRLLLSAEYLLDINPLKKYELLFDNLDCSPLKGHPHHAKGRPPVPKSGLLRALIYKNLNHYQPYMIWLSIWSITPV